MADTVRVRAFPAHGYRAIYVNGQTLRIKAGPEVSAPPYPEFYDLSITSVCHGECPWCYQDSRAQGAHADLAIIDEIFAGMTLNQRPFQVALGGGEPTEHPEFVNILRRLRALDIAPNFTTNGMYISPHILRATQEYCDGVAVSAHEHLGVWPDALRAYAEAGIRTNLHFIVADVQDAHRAWDVYREWNTVFHKLVLLPYEPIGRAEPRDTDLQAVVESHSFDQLQDVGFGAGFYETLLRVGGDLSLYEPEMFSKYIDCVSRRVKPSSFDTGAGTDLTAWLAALP